MKSDLRNTPEYGAVAEHLRRLHGPALGRPHALSDLHASSDGGRIAVTGLVFDELVGVPRAAVYTCHEGRLHPVSATPGSARGARFAPDGSTLAFLSDRDEYGVFQLYLLTAGRLGEAVVASTVPGTVEYLHWSSDGRRILLGVAGRGADLSGGQGSGTTSVASEEHPDWQPLVETDEMDSAWRSLWLYTIDTDEVSQLSSEGMNCWEAGWCGPDRVVTVAPDNPSEDSWYGAALTLIDVDSGSTRELFRGDAQLGLPTGSPDGQFASVVQATCSDRWVVAGDLTLIDVSSGASSTPGTEGADVTSLQWIDATQLGYFGQRHLDSVAGVLDARTEQACELFSTERACGGVGFYPGGVFTTNHAVLTIQESYDLPPQVVISEKGEESVLASIAHAGTDYLSSVAGEARAMTWTAPDGLEIEGILCAPPGDGPFPLVVNIHGGPVWAFQKTWSMSYPWVPLLVSRGYAVLNPNPRGSGGRGQQFVRHVVGDMGGADTTDYLSGIDALVQRGLVDPERVGVIGGSYGGYMSSWLITQDQRFAAAVPVSPVTDWYSQSFTSNIAG